MKDLALGVKVDLKGYYTLASLKFMENFATLNVALVSEWLRCGVVKADTEFLRLCQ
jgi:hypothetical protein